MFKGRDVCVCVKTDGVCVSVRMLRVMSVLVYVCVCVLKVVGGFTLENEHSVCRVTSLTPTVS